VKVAVTCVSESITTESAAIPARMVRALKFEVKKFFPVKTIAWLVFLMEVTSGKLAVLTYSYLHFETSLLAQA